jgi:phosphatidylserine/phosphatidylglycerophosphate/cardiolipin synthase-like enzyme
VSECRATVLVTGPAWMGSGIGSIETALKRLLSGAREDVAITAYSLSGSADPLFEWIEEALMRGVRVKLIYNKVDRLKKAALSRLDSLAEEYPHFLLYDFADKKTYDLHAKAVVADRRKAIVGSSNLSVGGILGNHEMAILIEGSPAATVGRAIERLIKSSYATLRVR